MGGSPGEGKGSPLQYSCLGNPMDGGAWRATVHGIAELDMTEQLSLTLMEGGLASPESASVSHVVLLEMTLLSYLFICLVGYTEHTDVNPFQAMDRMMLNMRNSMQELQRNFGHLSVDPNGHSFSSSSVMTYSKVGDEPPKVFQASTQTRRAPGGIKETRKALRDSDSGLEKMAVGHHLHDRAHVIKKSKNNKTGDEEVNQEFINMNECDAHAFDDEWQNEILKYQPRGQWRNLDNSRMRSVGHENSGSRELKRREKHHQNPAIEHGRRSNVFVDKLNIKGSPVKINKK